MTDNKASSIEEVIKRIAECGTIAVVLPETPGMEIIGSAAALASGLRALEKTASVFGPPALPGRALLPWRPMTEDDEPLREFIISFDLSRSPIKELKYERNENRLDIILSPTGSRLKREDVEFRYGTLRYDLVITLGVPNLGAAQASINRAPELLLEKPILNIDVGPANTCYGEMNLVPGESAESISKTMPELIRDVLAGLKVPPDDPERANALLAALAAATGEFRPLRTSAGAFSLAGELLSRGADPKVLRRALIYPSNLAQDQLAARAVVRSRFQKEPDLVLSLLTAEDFLKTNAAAQEVPAVLEKIMDILPYAGHYALLWQDPADGQVRCRLAEADSGKGRDLEKVFPSFAAAEEHISQLPQNISDVE